LDLCIVDVHMPGMDGLTFIEEARKIDPCLGCLIFSAFDSSENLRRAIPLNVFDFVPKPLPDPAGFEERIPEWVERTRAHRKEQAMAKGSETVFRDLELARIERDIESTASESARDALFQTANFLTTTQALLLNASQMLEPLGKTDPRLTKVVRSLEEAYKQVEVAATVTEQHFGSAYANRESSPARIDVGVEHAISIALRLAKAESRRLAVDCDKLGPTAQVAGLTGIDFLLMVVPAIVQALELAGAGTTVRIHCTFIKRLDETYRDAQAQSFIWINRRNVRGSIPGISLSIRASATPPTPEEASAWLHGDRESKLRTPSSGLVHGVQKAKGAMGISISPNANRFEIVLALPS
jgi:DNA-binding NarL/FixJ family response regulator